MFCAKTVRARVRYPKLRPRAPRLTRPLAIPCRNKSMANAAHDTVQSVLAEAENRLWTSFTTSQSFKHSVLKGSDRESAVADFLRQRLPSRFAVTTGEVID